MNRLPQVLQNEIWEYVRGDRAYWKQIHSKLVNEWFPAWRNEAHDKMIYLAKILASPKAFGAFAGISRPTTIRVGTRYNFSVMMFPPDHPQRRNEYGVTGFDRGRDPIENFSFVNARAKVLEHFRRYHASSR